MLPQRHRRSAIACQKCRERKVRCSVSVTGVPCASCTQDGAECKVRERQRPRRQRKGSLLGRRLPLEAVPADRPMAESTNILSSQPPASTEQTPIILAPRALQGELDNSIGDDDIPLSITERRDDLEERTGVEISSTALGQDKQTGQVPFYIGMMIVWRLHDLLHMTWLVRKLIFQAGEAPGFTSILDLCTQSQQPVPRHILLSSDVSTSLSTQDHEYLQHKGVFTLPQKDTCIELLRAYFHHIHPIMPIIDARILLIINQGSQTSEWNLLLLWSMFFAAANFVDTRIWMLEGYSSRKDMKTAMYSRAKCMYDNGGETDKVVLLQSALLMGFWHSKRDGHAQPWYWTGVAISLCQILGLHRDPDSVRFNSDFPYHRRSIWRRIWWSCFFRDRWLSLTLGRPLRIHLDDCDTPMPSVADVISDLAEIPESIASAYIPTDLPQLADYWVILIGLSEHLGEILTLSYKPFGPNPTLQQVESLKMDLLQFRMPNRTQHKQSRLGIFYLYHLHLHYQASLITLYRPYITKTPEHLPPADKEAWQSEIRSRLEAAALASNAILNDIVRERLLDFAGPMTPPLLVPAMHIHLLNCQSPDALTRRLGFNKLELCMMVMKELQETYTAAAVYRGVFLGAIHQLHPDYLASPTLHDLDAPNPSSARVNPAEGSVSDDVLNALLDETSFLDFWDTFTDM